MAISLNSLPPELLALVMEATVSPQELYRLISASPACLRVFAITPHRFLASAISNSLPPEITSQMVAILCIPESGPLEKRMPQIEVVLDQYFDNFSSFTLPTDKSDLIQICRLSTCVSDLIDGYFADINDRFETSHPSVSLPTQSSTQTLQVHASAPLSSSEEIRLQRTFLRFELYSRIFPADKDPAIVDLYSPEIQRRLFMYHLPSWEIEEMRCVYEYYSSILGNFIDEMEEDLIEAVLKAPGARVHDIQLSTENRQNDEMRSLDRLHLTDLVLFSQHNRAHVPDNITFMTSLGLRRLQQFSRASKRDRMDFIKENSPRVHHFFPEALLFRGHDSVEPLPLANDDPSRPSHCYFKFGPPSFDPPIMVPALDLLSSPVRDLGYAFWDSQRMSHPQIFNKLKAARTFNNRSRSKRIKRMERIPMEKRLKNVTVPENEFRRIETEFGSTLLTEQRAL